MSITMAMLAVTAIPYSDDMTPVALKRGLVTNIVRANSKPGQAPAEQAYRAALRASVVAVLDAADAGAARASIHRALWCENPMRPSEGDSHACPDYMWNSVQSWLFDACNASLGTTYAAIGAAVDQD